MKKKKGRLLEKEKLWIKRKAERKWEDWRGKMVLKAVLDEQVSETGLWEAEWVTEMKTRADQVTRW